jgi:TonB-linked SusC/RagA family outer membrane protein
MKKMTYLLFCLFLGIGLVTAQTRQITGTVISVDDGEPIIGASVIVKGTTTGTVTDIDGNFSLNVSTDARTLVISYVGMKMQELPVQSVMRIGLTLDAQALDEVMVVAYGTAKKSSFTGSAANIKPDQIGNVQSASLTKALEGAAPGIQVTGNTGMPGSNAKIRIRGIGSINASSAPLYVVDGAPFDGDISTISTDDIESITVLKDATSAALYGARGANGVIMVTTKKGSKGKVNLNAKVNLGAVTRGLPEYDRVNEKDYYEIMWEGWRNALVNANGKSAEEAAKIASDAGSNGIVGKLGGYNSYNVAADQLIGLDGKLNPNAKLLYSDDWNKELSRVALRQDYNASLSGGTDNSTFYASVSYNNENGIFKWSDYERFTARVGVTSQVNNWLKVDANISGATSMQNGFRAEGTYTTNPFYYGRVMAPIYPIYQYDENGTKKLDSNGNPMYDMGGGRSIYAWPGHTRGYAPNSNLLVTLPADERSTERNIVSARIGTEIKFLTDFTLRVSGNTDISNDYQTTYQNYLYGDAESVKGRSTKKYKKTRSYTFNQVLTWNKTFDDHSLSLLAGHENYLYSYKQLEATRTGFTIPSTELIAASVPEGSLSYTDEYSLEGYLFQTNYDYANKYYASFSTRYDGSSRFYRDNRWGFFWSLGGGWRLSEEAFLQDAQWINNLKLKASYGQQGNDSLMDEYGDPLYYGWQSLYSFDDKNNGNFNGATHSQLLNKELSWEKNANLNVGVEFGLLDFMHGELDYYMRESSNLLFKVPNPQSTGIEYTWKNIGTMRNTGIEIMLGFDILKNTDFKWSLDVNATTPWNKVTKMPKDGDSKPQEIISGVHKLSEGKSRYTFWLRKYAGVDPANGDALFYKDIKDAEGNVTGRETTNSQNEASFYYVGDAVPDVYGGITNNFSYKGFDLSLLFTYQIGGDFYDSNYATLMHPGSFGNNWSADIKKRWQKPGDITDVPRVQNNYTAANAGTNSRWLKDGSFLSLRNITLSYTLPKSIQSKLDMKNCKLFVTGDNLYMFTTRKGMDPQQNVAGSSDFTYVQNRVVSFGINVTF